MFSTGLRKVIAFVAFWGLGLIAFYFFFWNPSISSIKKTQEEMRLKQKDLTQIKKDVETWPKTKTRESLQKAEEEFQKLIDKVPPEEDIPGILEHIRKYGVTKAHLNISGITNITGEKTIYSPDEKSKQSTHAKVTYTLVADGTFFDVIRFLSGLEAAERLILIEELNVKRGEYSNVHAEVILSLFYSKPELATSEATSSQL